MSEEIIGRLIGDKISLGQEALPDLYEQGYFGRPKGKGLELSLVEAAYLLDRSRIKVLSEGERAGLSGLFPDGIFSGKGL